jgi:hypothetical protein
VKIVAPYHDGSREVEVHQTETPGLYVGEDQDRRGHWMVISRGGAVLADLPDPEPAVLIAVHLGGLGDWDRPAADLLADTRLRQRWNQFMHRTGLAQRFQTPVANADAIAQAESQTAALNRREQ